MEALADDEGEWQMSRMFGGEKYRKRPEESYQEYLERQPTGTIEVEVLFYISCPHCGMRVESEPGRTAHVPSDLECMGGNEQCEHCWGNFKLPPIPELPRIPKSFGHDQYGNPTG